MKTIQKVINELVNWGKDLGLIFNSEKTVVVLFKRRVIKENRLPPRLEINGQAVGFSTSMRYLGVTLDVKLNWTEHFNKTISECKKTLMYTSTVIRKQWGPRPQLSKWLFTGIIRPKLSYASLAWGHTLTTKTKINKLTKLNRLAAITITPV